jgi:23S rRNA pseudouridine1911/1915/1917 synthase
LSSLNDELTVTETESGMRLDAYLTTKFPQFSRSKLQQAILEGQILIEGVHGKPAARLVEGQRIKVDLNIPEKVQIQPEKIDLDVLYEDEFLVAINKPAGMVVHPAKGNWKGTLVSALAYRFNNLSSIGGENRPGIVHRLDRDTSGVIIVAKTDVVHTKLAAQFENRQTKKHYLAIVTPPPDRDRDIINKPIGVHPYQREKMTIRTGHTTSRPAETFYEVVKREKGIALLNVFPKTGRTHQIRVHLAHIGCPVLCDALYSGRSRLLRKDLDIHDQRGEEVILARQALHALSITFTHPDSGRDQTIHAPIASDILHAIDILHLN